MYYHVLNCIKMNIALDLRAIYGHFAVQADRVQPRADLEGSSLFGYPVFSSKGRSCLG